MFGRRDGELPLIPDGYVPLNVRYGQVDAPIQRPLVPRYVFGPLEPQKQCKVPPSNFLTYDQVVRGSHLYASVVGDLGIHANRWGGTPPKNGGPSIVQRIMDALYGNTPKHGAGIGSIYNGAINNNPSRPY